MRKKTIWTIELPADATRIGALEAAIHDLNGKVVSIKEKVPPLTDEECRFWYKRWQKLPFSCCRIWNNTAVAYSFKTGEFKTGEAKCCPDDVFNEDFGHALAAARLFHDRKLERALLRFTSEQIKKYF